MEHWRLNMEKSTIFAGLIGLAVGGGIGGFAAYALTKKKYTDILEKTVDNYETLLEDGLMSAIEDDIPDEFKRYKPSEEVDDKKISSEEKKVIKEKLRYNNTKTTEYARMYSPSEIVDIKAEEGEPDPEELTEAEKIEEENEEEATNIFEAASKSKTREPVIISEEHYNDYLNNSSSWECEELFLYNDGTVATEDDRVIDGEELDIMVGNCFDKYNFRNSHEKEIYIQCYALSTVYHVTKFDKPFIKV